MKCSCPTRYNERTGEVEKYALDRFCQVHGATEQHCPTCGQVLSAGCNAIADAKAAIIQTTETARAAVEKET